MRLASYKEVSLKIIECVQEAFQYLFNQRRFHIEEPFGVRRAPRGAYEALVQWQDFSGSDSLWEPLDTLYRDAHTYIVEKLTPLQLPLTTRKAILRRHHIHISSGAGARLSPPTDGNVVH